MDWYWWILLIAVTCLVYFGRFRKAKAHPKDMRQLNFWLTRNGFKLSDITFSVHDDNTLLSNDAEHLIVGFGAIGDQSAGFFAELGANGKVLDSKIIHPGAASYHAKCARDAKFEGALLKHKLTEKSAELSLFR